MPKYSEFKRKPEIIAGIFLLLSGLSVVVTLLTDVRFMSSFYSVSEDIAYLSDNIYVLYLNSVLWMITALFMTICAAGLISAVVPHHSFLGYLQGFLFILASAMFYVAAIKGFSLRDLMLNYSELELANPDSLKINVLILLKEKNLYLTAAYVIIGLSFIVVGLFAFLTMKIRVVSGILSLITGFLIIVFTLFIPDSLLVQIGLIMACLMFFILTVQFLFKGLEKKQKRIKEGREIHE